MIGAGLSAFQAGVYYYLIVNPATDVRAALARVIARLPLRLQTKLLGSFLLLVAAIFGVGWFGFGAMEDMHEQLHLLELRTDWLGHVRFIRTTIQQQEAVLEDPATLAQPATGDRLRQLDTQIRAEFDHLGNYPLHGTSAAAFVMSPAVLHAESTALHPRVVAVQQAYARFNVEEQTIAQAYAAGDRAAAATATSRLGPARWELQTALDDLESTVGTSLFSAMLIMDQNRHDLLPVIMLVVLFSTVLAVLLGTALTQTVIRPVQAVVSQLEAMGGGDFSQRLPVSSADELGWLAREVNRVNGELAGLYGQLRDYASTLEEKVTAQVAEIERLSRFRRYFSPQIADVIAREGAELAPQRRELTVLVADVRGFPVLGVTAEPEEIVARLNACLAALTEVIFDHGGTLDKYLGDGLLAYFGDPLPQPDHAARALRAGRALPRCLHELQRQWFGSARAPLAIGIGLSSRWMTVGTIGSPVRQEYTVVGDAVRIADQLAAQAEPGEVLLEERTRRLLGEDLAVVSHGEVVLPGTSQPIAVYVVVDERPAEPAGPGNATAVPDPVISSAATAPRRPAPVGNGRPKSGLARETSVVNDILARIRLFAAVPPHELADLARQLRVRRLKKGETISNVDEPSGDFFLIRTGTVKVTRPLATGEDALMSILGTGEYFGELAILEGQTHVTSATALEPTELLALSREVYLSYVRTHPVAAGVAIALLSERIAHLGDRLEESYALELPQRLARRLLALGRSFGRETPEGLVIGLALTQSDLAGMVGATRQRVNRQLADWQDQRVIRMGPRGALVIARPDILSSVALQDSDT